MSIYRIKNSSLKITNTESILALPALLGNGTDREFGQLIAEICDGRLVGQWGVEFKIAGQTTLMGWGELDGDAAIIENDCGVQVACVPMVVIDQLRKSFDLKI